MEKQNENVVKSFESNIALENDATQSNGNLHEILRKLLLLFWDIAYTCQFGKNKKVK